MEKTCFKCLRVLPLAEFYTHPQMADGHVNKCRDCNKKDVQRNYRRRKEYYRAYDAVRNRSKERTAKRAEYAKKNDEGAGMKLIEEMTGLELREACAIEVMGVHVKKQRGARSHLRDLVIPGGVNGIDYVQEDGEPDLTVHDLIEAVPAYESSIEAAFQVVEKMREKGFVFFYLSTVPCGEVTRSKASFARATPLGRKSPVMYDEIAETVPLAIARASLKAVRAK